MPAGSVSGDKVTIDFAERGGQKVVTGSMVEPGRPQVVSKIQLLIGQKHCDIDGVPRGD